MALGNYVLNHAEHAYYVEGTEAKNIENSDSNYNKYNDFKFSFDNINFTSEEDAKAKLNEVAKDLAKIEFDNPHKKTWKATFKLSDDAQKQTDQLTKHDRKYGEKGIEILKKSITKNRFGSFISYTVCKHYERKVDMNNTIIAVHTKSLNEKLNGKDTYKVNPHIHIVLPRDKAFGKNYTKLKIEVNKILDKHNLISSINTPKIKRTTEDEKEFKILKDRLSNFSWVVAKHQDRSYAFQQLSKIRGENSVNLLNIESKLNRYLELNGSVAFAKKLQINLKEKMNIDIKIDLQAKDKRAEYLISEKRHLQIIDEVKQIIINKEKMPEAYRNFGNDILRNKSIDIKDIQLAKCMKELYINSRFIYQKDFSQKINTEKINYIVDKYKNDIINIEKLNLKNNEYKFRNEIYDKQPREQKEIRDLMSYYDIKDFRSVMNKSEFEILYTNNLQYVRENISFENFDSSKDLRVYIGDEIQNMNSKNIIYISDNWKEKIGDTIYEEKKNKYDNKEKEIERSIYFTDDFAKYVEQKLYLTQKELREDMYSFGVQDCKAATGKSEFEIVYNGNMKFIENRVSYDDWKEYGYGRDNKGKEYIIERINGMTNLSLNDNWKNKISDTMDNKYKNILEEFTKTYDKKHIR